LAVYEGCIA